MWLTNRESRSFLFGLKLLLYFWSNDPSSALKTKRLTLITSDRWLLQNISTISLLACIRKWQWQYVHRFLLIKPSGIIISFDFNPYKLTLQHQMLPYLSFDKNLSSKIVSDRALDYESWKIIPTSRSSELVLVISTV